jgi:hypothetical protein
MSSRGGVRSGLARAEAPLPGHGRGGRSPGEGGGPSPSERGGLSPGARARRPLSRKNVPNEPRSPFGGTFCSPRVQKVPLETAEWSFGTFFTARTRLRARRVASRRAWRPAVTPRRLTRRATAGLAPG